MQYLIKVNNCLIKCLGKLNEGSDYLFDFCTLLDMDLLPVKPAMMLVRKHNLNIKGIKVYKNSKGIWHANFTKGVPLLEIEDGWIGDPVSAVISTGAAIGSAIYGNKKQKEAQNKAQDAAQQEAERAREEQLRIEEKYGTLTPEEQEREKANYALAKQRQAEYERRAGLSGEQLLAEEGSVNQRLINEIRGRQGLSGEELFSQEGELNRRLAQEALTNQPLDYLAPELELARMAVNQEANRRGVFGGQPEGGIRFEQLGRANVELAVNAAKERIAQRNALAGSYLTMGANARSEAGTLAERSLAEKERARAELQDFLTNQQNFTEAAKGRTAQSALQALPYGEAGAVRAFDTNQAIFGQKAAEGAAIKNAGLNSLGKMVGLNFGGDAQGGKSGAGQSTGLTSLRGEEYDPLYGLSNISGSGMSGGGASGYGLIGAVP